MSAAISADFLSSLSDKFSSDRALLILSPLMRAAAIMAFPSAAAAIADIASTMLPGKDAINAQKRAAYAARKLSTNGENPAKIGLDNDRYTIAEPKISKFLLKPGAKHSAEFFDVGYSEQDGSRLNANIYQQFDEARKTDIRTAEDGTESFSIFMELGTTDKKTFRTVWQREPDSEKPRLITAHREDKK